MYHHLKFGYACFMRRNRHDNWGEEEWFEFRTVAQFWDWVIGHGRPKTKLYLFCHNTSFDLPVLDVFQSLPERGFQLISAIIEAPPTILRYRTNTKCDVTCAHPHHTTACKGRRRTARSIIILDSLNLFRMPLKELGLEIGLQKLEMPADNDLTIDWESYGKRDVEVLRTSVLKWFAFLQHHDFGSFAPTLAGQAMRAFRHKYMRHRIMIDNDIQALALTREGYYGGRCEAFFIGRLKDKFWLLDVNSMYPSVMARESFPNKLTTYSRHLTVGDLAQLLENRCVTADVSITTDKPFAPCRHGKKLIFPVGSFRTILSTPEIRYALTRGYIDAVHRTAIYEKAPLFSTMMHDLYNMRLQYDAAGNKVYAFLCRKLINSFYGKWGQSGFKWDEKDKIDDLSAKHWTEINYETKEVRYYRQFGGLVQMRGTAAESQDSFPAIAAHVTAFARMLLYDLILLAGVNNVYYSDTDSLLVNNDGYNNLACRIDSTSLGFLSIKGQYEDIEIFGCKDYVFGSKFRAKGVRNKAIWLNRNTVEQERWAGLRGLLALDMCDSASTKRIVKRLSRQYDKAQVLPSGRVIPWVFPLDGPPD